MFLAWCVVFHHILLATSLQTSQPEDRVIDARLDLDDDLLRWDDDFGNETYYEGEFEPVQKANTDMRHLGNECEGCVFTADLRCQYRMKTRGGFYHRLADCLVPAYELIEQARKFLPRKVCILSQGGIIFPALGSIVDVEKFQLIEEGAACSKSLAVTAVDAHSVKGAEAWYFEKGPAQGVKSASVVPLNLPKSMAAFHRDVIKLAVPPPDPTIILLIRHGHARAFTQETKHRLIGAMSHLAGERKLGFTEYHGRESLQHVLNIFSKAVGVVGYHGAGLVNTLFTKLERRKSCVMEISSLTKGGNEWRSNDELAHLNSVLVWEKFHLKYADLMRANPYEAAHFDGKFTNDKFLKWLPLVDMTDSDVASMNKQFKACLKAHAF